MQCQRCKSGRVLVASSHGRDCHCVQIKNNSIEADYLPRDLGIGGGDDMEIEVCLDCGQLQGTWPLATSQLEKSNDEE